MSEEHPHGLGRRQFLKAIGAGLVTLRSLYHLRGILDPFEVMAAEPARSTISADEALRRLVAGNQRARAGRFTLVDRIAQARRQTVQAQHPFAVILGCSDARVPVELVFDQGIGDLFVVRVAGNTVGDLVVGSIEYAVDHLGVPLVVVLGHEGCGAVKAAIESVKTGKKAPGNLDVVVAAIRPVVRQLAAGPGDVTLERAVDANVKAVVGALASDLRLADDVKSASLRIVGARYSLQSGRVKFFG